MVDVPYDQIPVQPSTLMHAFLMWNPGVVGSFQSRKTHGGAAISAKSDIGLILDVCGVCRSELQAGCPAIGDDVLHLVGNLSL